jgi:hypothetical protein
MQTSVAAPTGLPCLGHSGAMWAEMKHRESRTAVRRALHNGVSVETPVSGFPGRR